MDEMVEPGAETPPPVDMVATAAPAEPTAEEQQAAQLAALYNGEDPDHWNGLCQQRIDDTYEYKRTQRDRTAEAHELHEGNEYDLTGAGLSRDAQQLYFKQTKILVTAIVAALVENGFDIRIKADPPPWVKDPNFLQLTEQYIEQYGLPQGDRSGAVSELLTHAENTINERHHLPILLQKWIEAALVDGPGASYCYTGVSPYSKEVVVKEYVPADQMWVDIHATDFYTAQWHCRFWPASLEQRIARFPEWEEYFKTHDEGTDVGKSPAAEKNSTSQFAPGYIQHHVFCNYEMVDDPNGGRMLKYPGAKTVVWRHGDKVLKIEPLPYLHEESPYDQLLGVTRQDKPEGMSFVLDILFGFVMAKNRLINAAIETAETMGRGKRLLNVDALENPDDAYDNSLSNLLVRPGFNLTEVVYNLVGADVSPAIRGALDILNREFPSLVGDKANPQAAGSDAPDVMKTGYSQAPLRARVRDFIARIAKKDIFNAIQFDPEIRAFAVSGGPTSGVVRYPPALFQPLINSTEAFFTIEVSDTKKGNVSEVEQAKITAEMIKLAREAMQADPGLSYADALDMGPDFEGKERMVRKARINEARRKREAMQAKAAGLPDPTEKIVLAKNASERGQGAVEVVKKAWQTVASKDEAAAQAVLLAVRSGQVETDFKIAQGEQKPKALPPAMTPGAPAPTIPIPAQQPTGPMGPGATV
jgi:hypothetical protein